MIAPPPNIQQTYNEYQTNRPMRESTRIGLDGSKIHSFEPPDERYDDDDHLMVLKDSEDPKEIETRYRFREFVRNFHQNSSYIYRDALMRHWNRKEFFLEVDLSHVNEFDEGLYDCLLEFPRKYLPLFEEGVKDALKKLLLNSTELEHLRSDDGELQNFQLICKSAQIPLSLRNLTSDHVYKLIKVPGIEAYYIILLFIIFLLYHIIYIIMYFIYLFYNI